MAFMITLYLHHSCTEPLMCIRSCTAFTKLKKPLFNHQGVPTHVQPYSLSILRCVFACIVSIPSSCVRIFTAL